MPSADEPPGVCEVMIEKPQAGQSQIFILDLKGDGRYIFRTFHSFPSDKKN